MNQKPVKPSDKVVQQAKFHANGWVYQIDGEYAPTQAVPSEVIMGAWQVDANGNIVGEFIANPKYKPKKEDESS